MRVEAEKLRNVWGMEPCSSERDSESERLMEEIEDLQPRVRLENLSVYQVMKVKDTAEREKKTYKYLYASWWEGSRSRMGLDL